MQLRGIDCICMISISNKKAEVYMYFEFRKACPDKDLSRMTESFLCFVKESFLCFVKYMFSTYFDILCRYSTDVYQK